MSKSIDLIENSFKHMIIDDYSMYLKHVSKKMLTSNSLASWSVTCMSVTKL